VKRYQGERLPERARIAVISGDALGNYVVATPLFQMLRALMPNARIDYFGGERTRELWTVNASIDQGFALSGLPPRDSALQVAQRSESEYALVINVEDSAWARSFTAIASGRSTAVVGPCLDAEGRNDLPFLSDARGSLWQDRNWTAADLPSKYPFLQSGFIGEVLCRLAYLEGPVPPYSLPLIPPPRPIADVLISATASLPEKLWPYERWADVVGRIVKAGLQVGVIGAGPSMQSRYWKGAETEQRLIQSRLATDLRGTFTLPQIVGAISQARAVLAIDNGILHLAAGTSTPTVGIFRHGIHRLWLPPVPNVTAITPGENNPVSNIPPDHIWEALECAALRVQPV